MRWFDSHNHSYLEKNFFEVIDNATNMGGITFIGLDFETSIKAKEAKGAIKDKNNNIETFYSVGLHPHDAKKTDQLEKIIGLVENEKPDAIGETGLDYFYMNSSKEDQKEAFLMQIDLALQNDLPLILHMRDAWDDLFEIYDRVSFPEKTILHCFTGDVNVAKWAVANDLFVSYSGIVTYNSAKDIQESVAIVPDSLLLVETDSPYLAPIPNRGKENEPQYIESIIHCLAGLRGDSTENIAEVTYNNCIKIFS